MISFEVAQEVVDHLGDSFDNHEFIFKYIELHENDYVDLLAMNNGHHDVFQTVNSVMGRDLERFSKRLLIEKIRRIRSFNIKGNKTYNQKWVKTR
jgi:hypothetical protein